MPYSTPVRSAFPPSDGKGVPSLVFLYFGNGCSRWPFRCIGATPAKAFKKVARLGQSKGSSPPKRSGGEWIGSIDIANASGPYPSSIFGPRVLGPIDIQPWRSANGGFPRFRSSRAQSMLRSGSRKTTILDSPSSECRLVLGLCCAGGFEGDGKCFAHSSSVFPPFRFPSEIGR